ALLVGACGSRQAKQTGPTPEELAAQARADSIEAARRAEEERRRLEEERRRAEEEARRAEEEARRAREILAEMVHFDFDKYDIRPSDQETLRRKAAVLRANPDVRVRIVGHADERGSDEYNLALGLRRANAVRDFLVSLGLDASRFETASMGEEQPLIRESNERAWAMNRRGEFHVTAGQVARTGM